MSATITINFRDFQPALKRVAAATSNEETRPVLQRVQVIASPARIRLQAADGFRLHRVDIWDDLGTFEFAGFIHDKNGKLSNPIETLLSPEQIKALLKVKIARKDNPRLTIDPSAGTVTLDGKKIAGTFDTESNFPQVDCLFPTHPALQVKVKSANLLAAAKTARVYSKHGSNVLQLHISDSIVVYAKSEEHGESWNVVTPEHVNRVQIHDIVLGVNADFLIDYLKHAAETVRLDLFGATKPITLNDGAGNDFTGLVMPMVIHDAYGRTCKDITCLTPADIPNPHARPDVVTAEFDLETGEFIRNPQDVEYTNEADAWKLQHTVKHDPEFGTHYAGKVIPDDIWTSVPEPGAVEYDLTQAFAYHVEPNNGRGKGLGLIALHFQNPRPDPAAPIAVDWALPATRHPLFATGKDSRLTVGECTRCTDPNHHALYDGLCGACQTEIAELEKSHR